MNKQYIEGVQKWKTANLMSKRNILMWRYYSLSGPESMSLLFKEQMLKKCKKYPRRRFFNCHVKLYKQMNK